MSAKQDITLHIYKNSSGLKHDTGAGHPECIARQDAVLSIFKQEPYSALKVIEAEEAETKWVAYAHDRNYIMDLQEAIPDSGLINLDSDTVVSPYSYIAAITGAGAACQAVQDIHDGHCDRAFCATRPPGHHAEPERAMGFCLFNNIFIAARYAQQQCGYKKIAIIDFDVHHGNGTDAMARRAENILYISSHQAPFYPGTGNPAHDAAGKTLNIELAAGNGSETFRKIYEDTVFPALHNFAPDFVMISAGFDAHKDDPLAQINLTEDDFSWVTDQLCEIAKKYCGGKVLSVLEGGYNLDALKSSCAAHLNALQK